MSQINANNFEVRIIASASNEADIDLDHVAAAVVGWEDDTYSTDDEDEEEFLVPDGEEDEDEEVQEEAQGELTLTLDMTAAAFAQFKEIRDSDNEYMLTVTFIYKDANGVPVFYHEYDCVDGLSLIQTVGNKNDEQPLSIELFGDYHDCVQFATIQPNIDLH